ncbi:FAD:protein FMN transferase [Nannocystaceae bacterium ST9]
MADPESLEPATGGSSDLPVGNSAGQGPTPFRQGFALALKLMLALGGLLGMVWMLWPKPPLRQTLEVSEAGSRWLVERHRAVLSGPAQGTSFTIVLSGEHAIDRLAAIQIQIDDELAAIDLAMSSWRADSELSRFAAAPAGQPFAVSARLLEVVVQSQQLAEASGGAFDPTVAPLVEAWGFGTAKGGEHVEPSAATLAELRERVGWRKLIVDREAGTLTKSIEGLRLDVAAIAPGYSADRLAAILDAEGLHDYMIELGGEVRSRGDNPEGEGWKIGIEAPSDADGARIVQTILRVHDAGVATSGDYRNYWEKDGVRFSHTIDPRTGRPIAHTLASVTVVHETAALADGWATALSVLGPDEGLELAARIDLAAYFLIRRAEGFEVRTTPAFDRLHPP